MPQGAHWITIFALSWCQGHTLAWLCSVPKSRIVTPICVLKKIVAPFLVLKKMDLHLGCGILICPTDLAQRVHHHDIVMCKNLLHLRKQCSKKSMYHHTSFPAVVAMTCNWAHLYHIHRWQCWAMKCLLSPYGVVSCCFMACRGFLGAMK